jgi:formamidopyrimidine-DNA glycosylase
MPELPEVETIRRDLARQLVGRAVEALHIAREDILRGATREQMREAVMGREVEAADRRGKNLILRLAGGPVLLINLGMTGQLFVCSAEAEEADHTHVVARLSDGQRLCYRDVRRFGHIELSDADAMVESFTLRNVGVDAMSADFTPEYLGEVLQGRTALLKSALLDQSRLAGLGNIYVCEALFRAEIDPEARCEDLAEDAVERLHEAIGAVLAESIEAEGTTISDYVTGNRVPGSFQERLEVYGREGEGCRRAGCEHTVVRIVQSNRSTFFCPGCQQGADANRSDPD